MAAAKHDSAKHRPCAISYIRFSSARQTGGSSTERQRQMVTTWHNAHPEYIRSDLTFADLGKSGYHGEHLHDESGFAKLLAAVEAGAIKAGDVVLCEAIDRTGRLHPLKMLNEVITPILAAGVNIITLDDNVTYTFESAASGHLFLLIAKIQAAHNYSKQLSERTKASYAIRREQAKATGKVKRHTPVWLTSDGEVIEHVAVHVRQAFELYVSGVGKTAIANRLRASGVDELKTCSGPTIEGWLRNKVAIGYWNDVKVYEPVVSDELFMLSQQRKKAVATKPRERTSKHLLVGLVKCGICGGNYIIHHKDGQPNNMRCSTHHRLKAAGCTNATTIPVQVVQHVYRLTAAAFNLKAMSALRLSDRDKEILTLTSRIEDITATINRLVDRLAVMDVPEIENKIIALGSDRKELERSLHALQQSSDDGNTLSAHDLANFKKWSITDPVKVSGLLKQAGYAITASPEKQLSVNDVDGETNEHRQHTFRYKGTLRNGNHTIGYKVLSNVQGHHEWLALVPVEGSSTTFSTDGVSVDLEQAKASSDV